MVKFGSVAADTVNVTSPTSLTAVVPDGATTGAVSVGTATGNNFTVTLSITSISPGTGPVGSVITIDGVGFKNAQGAPVVTGVMIGNGALDQSAWEFDRNNDNRILATVPDDATTGPVKVLASGGKSARSHDTFSIVPVKVAAQMIVFARTLCDDDTDCGIFKMNGDGTGDGGSTKPTQLTHNTSTISDTTPQLSADGTKIVFTRTSGDVDTVWKMNADGTGATALTPDRALLVSGRHEDHVLPHRRRRGRVHQHLDDLEHGDERDPGEQPGLRQQHRHAAEVVARRLEDRLRPRRPEDRLDARGRRDGDADRDQHQRRQRAGVVARRLEDRLWLVHGGKRPRADDQERRRHLTECDLQRRPEGTGAVVDALLADRRPRDPRDAAERHRHDVAHDRARRLQPELLGAVELASTLPAARSAGKA